MYLPFSHLPKYPKIANFESFRKMLSHLYTVLNRLVSGKTYVDLFSAQSIATPITGTNGNLSISKTLPYDSVAHIWNNIRPSLVIDQVGINYSTGTAHDFVVGMPIAYSTTGTALDSLNHNRVYWIKDTPTGTSFTISDSYGGSEPSNFVGTIPSGDHIFRYASPLTKINEVTLVPKNNTYPSPSVGNLAYGELYSGTRTTLYYNSTQGYRQVKLGWNGGNGYYNNESTFAQKHTGWCHGIGKYKILTATNQIKLIFDSMEVREPITGARDLVISSRTNPVSNYSILITNTTAGLNSIDTGVILANTGYYVYLVYNPETQTYGALLSLSHDYPEFPTESSTGTLYRYYQRLGWINTDADGNFFPSVQVGKELIFYQKPDNALSLTFYGGGTSVDSDLYSKFTKDSNKYPYPEYLSSMDIYLNWTGTGYNRDIDNHIRSVSFNSVPVFEITTTGTTATLFAPPNYIFNDYPLPLDQNIKVSVAHPDDTGGTDFSSIGFALTGFRFNGELYV
jgi:hypothetical protein